MDSNTFKLDVVTPDATIFSGDVEAVTLPGACGEMQVYAMHVPLMTQLLPGRVVIRRRGKDEYLAVGEGFVKVTGDSVTILTDMAIAGREVDAVKAEEARRLAKARYQQTVSDEEAATVSAAVAHAVAQIQHKQRRRP